MLQRAFTLKTATWHWACGH